MRGACTTVNDWASKHNEISRRTSSAFQCVMISSTLLPAISDGAFTLAGSAGVVAAAAAGAAAACMAPAAGVVGAPAAGAMLAGAVPAGAAGKAAGVGILNLK